ncbi:MAG: hypothetical protein ACRDSK_23205 [Actinophytocola sp.]|uniref:hypothetical protein n=1 Tax=Actinophytocola sp. TaxID=1872138 RepID=UPI003D6A5B67
MTAAVETRRRWPLLRVLLTAHVPFVVLLWLLFTVVAMVITGIVAAAAGISDSILHQLATQLPRWLLFGLGIDVVSTYLRIQLAHGRTRREFLGQAVLYSVVVSGVAAVLITLGYLLERGYYAVFGWSQDLSSEAVFTAANQYPAILGTYWLSLLLWTVAGLVIGLGFFRDNGLGILTIPIGLVVVLPALALFRNDGLPVLGEVIADYPVTVGTLLAASAVVLAVAVAAAWAIVRDAPMKTKAP